MRLISISFLKTFAALIIINSHCGQLYPIPVFAKGGALGNSLFFLMTGFLLFPIKLGFIEWIKKRYIRLYIPIIILGLIITLFNSTNAEMTLYNFFFRFVFPEHRWFVCALLVMYPIYYIIISNFNFKKYLLCALVLLLMYIYIYIFKLDVSKYVVETALRYHGLRFSYIYSFFLVVTGGLIHFKINNILEKLSEMQKYYKYIYFLTFLLFSSYFIFVFLMNIFPSLCKIQFLETILCITTTLGIFIVTIINEKFFQKIKYNWYAKFLNLGDYTLEIYLIQFLIIDFIQNNFNIFPLNIFITYILTCGLAIFFNKIVKVMNGFIAQLSS